jgi:hypothetical protein
VARDLQPPPQQLRVLLQHLPGDTPQTWVSQPYALYKNEALVAHGVTDATGHITIDTVDPGAAYAVELGQGLRFAVPVAERFASSNDTRSHLEQRLSSQGVRADGADTASRKAQAARNQRT